MNYDTKEKLANEVQKYPFLYDKSDDDYRMLTDEAWNQ